jgi:signal recognition particle subunit SRP68
MSRNFLLARIHTIHPTPSYSSSIRLLTRSSDLSTQARTSLFDSGPIAEPITTITPSDIDTLESDIKTLDLASKRALFAERVEKPIFFDTAFNYVEMPMDDLLYRAGKGSEPKPAAQAVTEVVSKKAGEMLGVVASGVPDRVKGLPRNTRESTPSESMQKGRTEEDDEGDEDEDMEDGEDEGEIEKPGPGKKGWLGGWFGRG